MSAGRVMVGLIVVVVSGSHLRGSAPRVNQ
jgi:hypothetical protein